MDNGFYAQLTGKTRRGGFTTALKQSSMTPEKKLKYFLDWAPEIYGKFWKTHLPFHWQISRRAVSKWANGHSEVDFRALLLLSLYRKLGHTYDKKTNTVGKSKQHGK